MYILLIFNNPECTTLNSFIKFETIKQIITWSGGVLKYSDSKKTTRTYKTQKSFFRIIYVYPEEEQYFFKYKYKDLRHK